MARKYSRNNAGRFASGGGGATARGGRLKTASGGKRATQTTSMKGASPAGTVGKPKGLKPGTVTAKAAAGGKGGMNKKAVLPAAAPAKKQPPAPPPWSKAMLRSEKVRKAREAGTAKPVAAKPVAAKPAKVKGEPKTKQPANTINPSSLRAAEKAYGEIKAQKSKFGSDKKVREEMIRRGFLKGSDPQGRLIGIAKKYRMRRGGAY